MSSIRFSLQTAPVPKARARVVRGGSYTPKRVRDYERAVRIAAQSSVPDGWDRTGTMGCCVRAYTATTRRVDVDNLSKAVLDAMNGVVYDDDSQIVHLVAEKAVDRDRPRVEVEVWRV